MEEQRSNVRFVTKSVESLVLFYCVLSSLTRFVCLFYSFILLFPRHLFLFKRCSSSQDHSRGQNRWKQHSRRNGCLLWLPRGSEPLGFGRLLVLWRTNLDIRSLLWDHHLQSVPCVAKSKEGFSWKILVLSFQSWRQRRKWWILPKSTLWVLFTAFSCSYQRIWWEMTRENAINLFSF